MPTDPVTVLQELRNSLMSVKADFVRHGAPPAQMIRGEAQLAALDTALSAIRLVQRISSLFAPVYDPVVRAIITEARALFPQE